MDQSQPTMNHAVRNWKSPTTMVVFFSAFRPATNVPTPAARIVSRARFQTHVPSENPRNLIATLLETLTGVVRVRGEGLPGRKMLVRKRPMPQFLFSIAGTSVEVISDHTCTHQPARFNHAMCPLCAGVEDRRSGKLGGVLTSPMKPQNLFHPEEICNAGRGRRFRRLGPEIWRNMVCGNAPPRALTDASRTKPSSDWSNTAALHVIRLVAGFLR